MSYIKREIELEDPAFRSGKHESASSADWEKKYGMICVEADRILAEEGAYHCEGRYYAKQEDAEFWRMVVAEKRIRERERVRRIS